MVLTDAHAQEKTPMGEYSIAGDDKLQLTNIQNKSNR